jgi:hypothetical protein
LGWEGEEDDQQRREKHIPQNREQTLDGGEDSIEGGVNSWHGETSNGIN